MNVHRSSCDRHRWHPADTTEGAGHAAIGGTVAIITQDEEMVRRHHSLWPVVERGSTDVAHAMHRCLGIRPRIRLLLQMPIYYRDQERERKMIIFIGGRGPPIDSVRQLRGG